ncbi:MAG: hypothetical protein Q9N68_10455 [Gammaproteobacteria bacterium]|nr:hypothetical protein [Gammaproteobacteria bacterium]
MPSLFSYSPKELSTDAFLAWLFESFTTEPSLIGKESGFFHKLGLCKSAAVKISDIKVSMQEKKTDLIVRFLMDGKESKCLFENKVNTTIHNNQLEVYKTRFPKMDHYFYLKLGFITFHEKLEAKSLGYELIDSILLHDALLGLKSSNCIVNDYIGFLKKEFIDEGLAIESDVKSRRSSVFSSVFSKSYAQQFFMSRLHDDLHALSMGDLSFSSKSHVGGSPWTQLCIAKKKSFYGSKSEFLIWKIEKRSGGWFLKLMQYSRISPSHKLAKQSRLSKLRSDVLSTPTIKHFKCGSVSNQGEYSSDIVVFYFDKNPPIDMLKFLPKLSEEIVKIY